MLHMHVATNGPEDEPIKINKQAQLSKPIIALDSPGGTILAF